MPLRDGGPIESRERRGMASEEPDAAEAAATPGGRRQRPPATIDLTATEIARASAETAQGAPADRGADATPAPVSDGAPATATAPGDPHPQPTTSAGMKSTDPGT